MDDALSIIEDEGVIRVGTGFEGRLTGIDIVASGGASGSGLEAVCETHAFLGESVDIRRVSLATVAADVEVTQVVG